MKPCPPPNGAFLLPHQHTYFSELMNSLRDWSYRESKIQPELPSIRQNISDTCSNDDELRAWLDEAGNMVRWQRVPGYWLAFILQSVAQQRVSILFVLASSIYAQAQTNFADDLALNSFETGFDAYYRNRAALGQHFQPVEKIIVKQLHSCHAYYSRWTRPFGYKACNPCTDHMYMDMSWGWLCDGTSDEYPAFARNDIATLTAIIERAQGDDFAYYGVLARRFLGLAHQAQGNYKTSAQIFEEALAEARRMRLEPEIGHLRRLFGYSLRLIGKNEEARHHFEQALSFEKLEPFCSYTGYWQAVSAYELGDVITRIAPQDAEAMRPALAAYREGREALCRHLSIQSPFPLARTAKQQIFRSFCGNAVQVACQLQNQSDLLAQVEAGGPREATELSSEIAAQRENSADSIAKFRRNRALLLKTLNTDVSNFEDYREAFTRFSSERRSYLQEAIAMDKGILAGQMPDEIIRRVTALRLPDTMFALFHFSETTGMLALLDMASGTVEPFPLAFGEEQIYAVHAEYHKSAAQDLATRKLAMDTLLSRYGEWLGPTFESFKQSLSGKHLKLFPRLQMNEVPLHAMCIRGQPLIAHCASVSYGQTLGMFMNIHLPLAEHGGASLRIVLGDRVPWYNHLFENNSRSYGNTLTTEEQPLWSKLMEACQLRPARDIMFACHGTYVANDLDASYLQVAGQQSDERVNFARVFEQLDLRGCRSIIMGACQSGRVRAEVGAEYLGLASAMLSSGVRYVVGALWNIPEVATAILIDHYLEILTTGSNNVCFALAEAQRAVMTMRRGEVVDWIAELIKEGPVLDGLARDLAKLPDPPFAHPYYWAGLQVTGDV